MVGFDGEPRLQVFADCTSWLKERGNYRRRTKQNWGRETDERIAKPVKKFDHLMDATRYVIAGGMHRDLKVERQDNADYSCPVFRSDVKAGYSQQRLSDSWDRLMRVMKQGRGVPPNDYLGNQY